MARRGARGQARPAALGRLPDDVDHAAVRHRAARGDLVREARPRPRPTCTRSCTPSPRRSTRRGRPRATSSSSTCSPSSSPTLARDPPRRAQGPGQRAAACTTPPARRRSPAARPSTGARRGQPGMPGRTMPVFQVVERDYTAIADKLATVGPLADTLGFTVKNVTYRVERARSARLAGQERRHARRRRRRPAGDRHRREDGRGDPHASPARPTASSPCRASAPSRSGSARRSSTSPRGRRRSGSPSPTPRSRPVPVITSPEWSGLGDRRPALRAVHRQHRAAQAVPHPDRPDALLPRPRLDARPRRGAADLPAAAGHAPAVR